MIVISKLNLSTGLDVARLVAGWNSRDVKISRLLDWVVGHACRKAHWLILVFVICCGDRGKPATYLFSKKPAAAIASAIGNDYHRVVFIRGCALGNGESPIESRTRTNVGIIRVISAAMLERVA